VNPVIPSTIVPVAAAAVNQARASASSTVDDARLPAAVRDGSPAAKQAYSTAQNFEEMLLQQLSQSLTQSSGLSGEGESGSEESGATGDASGGMLASLLPQTLAEGVMRSGGIGLAAQLMGALDPSAASTAATTLTASAGGAVGQDGGVSAAQVTDASAVAQDGGVAARVTGRAEEAGAGPAIHTATGGVSA
jgi:Rod binding domain-containing protein